MGPASGSAGLAEARHKVCPGKNNVLREEQAMAKVMVVDDKAEMRMLLEARLRQSTHRVVTAASGEEALTLLTEKGAPDVVVADVSMPGMAGLELHAPVRQISAYAHVPVIFLSGHVGPADVAHGNELGTVYLPKPVVLSALKCAIDAAVAAPAEDGT